MQVSGVAKQSKPLMDRFLYSKPVAKVLKSEALGKVLDVAEENQVLCSSLFALGICLGPRPITNFIVTPDKQDATYASCHSISSGLIGYAWPIVFVTPISKGLKGIAKEPVKYLKAETIKKFYPSVKTETIVDKGKEILKVVTDAEGNMLREDGSKLFKGSEPLIVVSEEARAKFSQAYPNYYVDASGGVVRSKSAMKTKKGIIQTNKKTKEPIGAAVQKKDYEIGEDGLVYRVKYEKDSNGKFKFDAEGKRIEIDRKVVSESDLTPITEEMEIGELKEKNVNKFINMVPDIILAPARASLTIALIPPVLNLFGIKKSDKSKAGGQPAPRVPLNVVSQSNNTVVRGTAPILAPAPSLATAPVKKGVA